MGANYITFGVCHHRVVRQINPGTTNESLLMILNKYRNGCEAFDELGSVLWAHQNSNPPPPPPSNMKGGGGSKSDTQTSTGEVGALHGRFACIGPHPSLGPNGTPALPSISLATLTLCRCDVYLEFHNPEL